MLQKINSLRVDVVDFAAFAFMPVMVGLVTFGTVYAIQEGVKALARSFNK